MNTIIYIGTSKLQKLVAKSSGLIVVLGLACTALSASAQQEPMYTQYMFNTVSVNPAYAGTRNAMNLLLLSRMQWVGLEGAPRTYTFSMHTPINNYKMGIGFSIVSDHIGPVDNSYFNINYAYRVQLTEKATLSMGIKGGIYNYYAGLKDVFLGNDNYDEAFSGNLEQKLQPNAGVGFYLYNQRYYVGFSIPKLIESKLSDSQTEGTVLNELKRHYFLMAGYVFDAGSDWKIKPAFIEKVVEGAPPSTDLTLQTLYKNTVWMGATYRLGDAIAFLAGVQINRQLFVGYSYDHTTSSLASYNRGSHEIVLSFDFDGFITDKVKSPRYF
ncbi:MAG: type IX secretion system membrane protein PorP/SprF [Breznakibacter sp.]